MQVDEWKRERLGGKREDGAKVDSNQSIHTIASCLKKKRVQGWGSYAYSSQPLVKKQSTDSA